MPIQTAYFGAVMPLTQIGRDHRPLRPIVEGTVPDSLIFDGYESDVERSAEGPTTRRRAIIKAARSGAVVFPAVQAICIQAKVFMGQEDHLMEGSKYCVWSLLFASLAGETVGQTLALRCERLRPRRADLPRLNDVTLAPFVVGCVLGIVGSISANLAVYVLINEHTEFVGPKAVTLSALSFGAWCDLLTTALGRRRRVLPPM